KYAWVQAKAPRNCGWLGLSLVASCSKSMASRSRSPRKRWRLPRPSCRSRRASSSASASNRAMKSADIRAMTIDQIDDEVLKLKKEPFNLRFQGASRQLENTPRVAEVRRELARLKTIARPKPHGSVEPAAKRARTGEATSLGKRGGKTAKTTAKTRGKTAAKS